MTPKEPRGGAAALLSVTHLHSIADLAVLQSLELSDEQATALHRLQDDFLRTCLSSGFSALLEEETAPRRGRRAHFHAVLRRVLAASRELSACVDAMPWPLSEEDEAALAERLRVATHELQRCYEAAHEPPQGDGAADGELLFLEFVIGLSMVRVTTEVRRLVVAELLRDTAQVGADQEVQGLCAELLETLGATRPRSHGIATAGSRGGAALMALSRLVDVLYLEALLSVTSDAIELCSERGDHAAILESICRYLKRRPALHGALRAVASLRHIPGPSAGAASASILAMAQVLHWSGIGADDSGIWLDYEPLLNLAHHSLGYSDNFSKTSTIIGDLVTEMRRHARDETARYLLAMAGGDGVGARTYRVFEDGSGPHAQFASEVADRLDELRRDRGGAVVRLWAGDSMGLNLRSLLAHARAGCTPAGKRACVIESVRYRDLTLPLLGGSGALSGDELEDGFDAYLVALALHHVTDGERGLHFLASALRFGAHVVRAGGCLAFLEIAELGMAVEMLMPLDLTDRVGYIPTNLHEVLSFSALAVPARRSGHPSGGTVKIPWQMREHGRCFPSAEHPVNVFVLMAVLELPESAVAELDALRAEGGLGACERRIHELMESCRRGGGSSS